MHRQAQQTAPSGEAPGAPHTMLVGQNRLRAPRCVCIYVHVRQDDTGARHQRQTHGGGGGVQTTGYG